MNEDSHLTWLDFGKNLMHEIQHVRNKWEVKKMNAKSSNCRDGTALLQSGDVLMSRHTMVLPGL